MLQCHWYDLVIQSALVIRTTFVPLCFSERNVLIASGTYECSFSQRNYLVFWKSVPMADVLITRVSYDVLITRVLITRVDCIYSACIWCFAELGKRRNKKQEIPG